jgi:hypothetical protein
MADDVCTPFTDVLQQRDRISWRLFEAVVEGYVRSCTASVSATMIGDQPIVRQRGLSKERTERIAGD